MAELEDILIDQSQRLISVESFDLGAQKILITAFAGVEALSTLSHFRIEFMSRGRALKPQEVLGQNLTLAFRADSQVRKFSGIISRVETTQNSIRDYYLHVADLVPPAWLLTLNRKCKIFHDQKATDIVSSILAEGNVGAKMKSSGAEREYTVQYCESDFNFVSRLLEDEGLFYYFDYEQSNCPITVCDGAADYVAAERETIGFYGEIESWQAQYEIGPSSFQHADWDFKAVTVLDGTANGLPKVQAPNLPDRPHYEYPGRYATAGEASQLARARMEEQESHMVRIAGTSDRIEVQTARKFKIRSHAVNLPGAEATADSYVIVQVEHRAVDSSGTPFDAGTHYENSFLCIPSELNFRPPRVTPRPVIQGPQTATVVDGPDEYGRAKVKFHWDETEQSCWARVGQNWAYNQMGTQFLPRIDSEVIVEFLDGDPDRPLIVGMVYNGKNKLPFDVPANKTQSGIRGANWDAAGAADKSNELRFEDKSGSEEIYIHAQKDFRRVIKNDDTLTVEDGNRTLTIKTGNVSETVNQGNVTLKLDQGNFSTTLTAGNQSTKLNAGASTVEAMQSITLKVGSNSLVIDQTGVTIKGMMIKIQGTVTLDMKSAMTTVNGDGMLTLKGGITMVN